MNPFISLMRTSVCLLSVLGLVVGAIVANSYTFLIIPAAIAVFLITGAGNVINDYYDYKIDKINAPHRPIPSGRIKRRTAMHFFVAVNLLGLLLSVFVSIYFFSIALLNSILLIVYSWKLKPIALIGNVVTSWLASSTFIASSLMLGDFFSIPASIMILAFISFLGTLSREILKDVRDVKGDKKSGAKTLPIILGKKTSMFISYVLLLIAAFSLWLPISFNIFNNYYYVGILPALILCFLSFLFHKNVDLSQKLIKYAMYFVFLGFILGSL